MPKPKPSTIRLQVFKGREAKLNKAIFHTLASRGPNSINTLLKEIRKQRGLHDTRDSVLRRRLQTLGKQGYLMKVGAIRTRWGYETPLFSMTPRAELAIALSKTDLDKFIKETDYPRLINNARGLDPDRARFRMTRGSATIRAATTLHHIKDFLGYYVIVSTMLARYKIRLGLYNLR